MSLRIDQDHGRFKNIVQGKIRENLKEYISKGEMIGRQGQKSISIPIPHIDIPRFRYSDGRGGVGQGDGNDGDPIGGDPKQGQGKGKAGENEGEHVLEVDVTLDELITILGDELQLPNIENKGKSKLVDKKDRYVGIRRVGPNSLRHFKRTYQQSLKRQIGMGTYDPQNPILIPTRDDMRFRSWRTEQEPVANAVIVYMMDVSGSMGDEQKEIVRIESFWIDAWLQRQYKGLETRFVIHDAVAREVDRDTFFRTRESGGTMISSAYRVAAQLLEDHYPASEWNAYLFHFSDGDNWSTDDTQLSLDLMKTRLLPRANLFGYGQVESPYGSGQFIKDLREQFGKEGSDHVVLSEIKDRGGIMNSIRDFLGKGK